MSARPGIIKSIIDIPLSRPRSEDFRTSQDFIKLRQEVGYIVREEAKFTANS